MIHCLTHLVDEDTAFRPVLPVQLCQIYAQRIQIQRVILPLTIQLTYMIKEMPEKLQFLRCIPALAFAGIQKIFFCVKCIVKHSFFSFFFGFFCF